MLPAEDSSVLQVFQSVCDQSVCDLLIGVNGVTQPIAAEAVSSASGLGGVRGRRQVNRGTFQPAQGDLLFGCDVQGDGCMECLVMGVGGGLWGGVIEKSNPRCAGQTQRVKPVEPNQHMCITRPYVREHNPPTPPLPVNVHRVGSVK